MPSTAGSSAAGAAAGSSGMSGAAGASGAPPMPAAGGGAPPSSSTNCGTRAGVRGKTSRTIVVGSDKRNFIAYLPEMANPLQPLPFVYVFHGANQTGQNLYDMTTYAALADREGIAVVFPDGQGVSSTTGIASLTPWNVTDGGALCGLGTLVSNPNPVDFAFMDAMKMEVQKDQCLDEKHVYSTGFSMGGYMTHHIACDRSDIRAAAPHSGGTLADLSSCKTKHVPIIIFHGTADPLIAANCDDPKLAPDPGFTASATLWAQKNGCKSTFTTVPANGMNGSNGSCYVYDGCPADGQVEMCSFQDLPHAWAGAPVCPSCIGEGPSYASATQLQWEFFKKYAW
jgi:polyhydroxybutyrate depolymerase